MHVKPVHIELVPPKNILNKYSCTFIRNNLLRLNFFSQVLAMRQKSYFWRAFMLTICHVIIIYWEAYYLISETQCWRWQHACTWDQVCAHDYWLITGDGFKEVWCKIRHLFSHFLFISSHFIRIWSEVVFSWGLSGQVSTTWSGHIHKFGFYEDSFLNILWVQTELADSLRHIEFAYLNNKQSLLKQATWKQRERLEEIREEEIRGEKRSWDINSHDNMIRIDHMFKIIGASKSSNDILFLTFIPTNRFL